MSYPSECGWEGSLPEFQVPQQCQSCQLMRSAGEVVRCRMGLLREPPKVETLPTPVVKPKITHSVGPLPKASSGLGDCLKAKFEALNVQQKPGCSCKDVQKNLNGSTVEEVEKAFSLYVDSIFDNVKNLDGLMGTLVQVYSWISPESAKNRIRELLQGCLDAAKAGVSPDAPESPVEPLDSQDGSMPV